MERDCRTSICRLRLSSRESGRFPKHDLAREIEIQPARSYPAHPDSKTPRYDALLSSLVVFRSRRRILCFRDDQLGRR